MRCIGKKFEKCIRGFLLFVEKLTAIARTHLPGSRVSDLLLCRWEAERIRNHWLRKMSRTKVPLFTTYFSYCQLGIALCYSLVWYSCCVYCATWISTWIKVVNQFFYGKIQNADSGDVCVCVCVLDISYFMINESIFRKAIIAFYSIWCWELNHRAESSYLLVGTICTSTSFLKTSSGNLVKSILTKRSIRVHYMISTSSEIWNSLQPKLAMFLCSRAVLFKKKVVNQLAFYRNSSNMFIKTSTRVPWCH